MFRPFEAFRITGRFISVIGSGGKTTFLRYLSRHLPGTVILTTSTRIYPFPDIPLVDAGDRAEALSQLRDALKRSRVVCLGRRLPSGKLAAPPLPFEALPNEADYVLVEADGAAGHPLKAHRPWEPAIPACSDMTVCLVGASGIGKPAEAACHCPGLFCVLAGIAADQPVRVEDVAAVLNRESLAECCLVNQADALEDPDQARRLCELINRDAFPCSLGR